jgi:hypothetical protein
MQTVQATYNHERDRTVLLIIFSFIIIPIGLLLACVGFSEYYVIGILGEGKDLPFGLINENPWYYETPELYAKHHLFVGIIFLLLSIAAIFTVLKKNNKLTVVFNGILVVLIVGLFLGF